MVCRPRPGYWQEKNVRQGRHIQLPGEYLASHLEKLSGSCQNRVDGLVGADFLQGEWSRLISTSTSSIVDA